MKATVYGLFLGTLLALLFISFVAGNDSNPTRDEAKGDEANHVADGKWGYGGGGGWGGPGGGGGWGGWGPYGGGGWGWGGRGGGWGWGGRGGGWGGGCRWGCCGSGYGYGGGCGRCCYTAQEALAYMQNEAQP